MDTFFGQALLLGYLFGVAYLVIWDIPKKKLKDDILSSLAEKNCLKEETILRHEALQASTDDSWRNLMKIVMNATYEQYLFTSCMAFCVIFFLNIDPTLIILYC